MVTPNRKHCRYVLLSLFLIVAAEAGFLVGNLSSRKELRTNQYQSEAVPVLSYYGNSNVRSLPRIRGGSMFSNSSKMTEEENKLKRIINPHSSDNYYLLNSLETWKSILFYSCMLFVLQKASSSFTGLHFLYNLPSKMTVPNFQHVWSFSLPLLSSSCCVIQLVLNTIAGVGCAGFNTILGPWRPFFVSILTFTTMKSFSSRRRMYQLIVSWAVTLLPEFVHFINIRSEGRKGQERLRQIEEVSNFPNEDEIELEIEGMGCVSCINKIDRTLRNLENIVEASSWLNEDSKGGKARVIFRYDNEGIKENLVNDIISSISGAGFDCKLLVDK